MFKKSSLLALVFSALFLAGCATNNAPVGSGGDAMEDKGDVIKIGMMGDLTGPAAALGQDVKAGVELFFSENPEIDGKKVKLIVEDGKCNGQDAANAAQKLVDIDKVQVIIGGLCSGETLAAAPIAEQAQVLLISPGSSAPAVSDAGDYVFRTYPSDANVGKTLVKALVDGGYTKIAMLSEQTDYSQGYRGVVSTGLEAVDGVELILDEAYPVGNSDFRTALTKAKDGGADALVTIANGPAGNAFTIKQAAELGFEGQIFGTDALVGPELFEIAKDAANGVKQAIVSEDPSRESFIAFQENAPEAQSAIVFMALGYDTAAILSAAIAEAGVDGTALKDWLYAMETWPGVAGDHSFDENGDNNIPATIKVVKDGATVFE